MLLTASNIQKVEYIDNPGLEYGKGAGAVVNYITKEPITDSPLPVVC